MKAKLIKTGDHYYSLMLINNKELLATTEDVENVLKLSLKNCEAIKNGYDLNELANEHCNKLYHEGNINWDRYRIHFKLGFQKAIEILGDKKFSELDMRIAYDAGASNIDGDGDPIDDVDMDFEGIIHSAQENVWDVDFSHDERDSEGNLILRRL